MVLSPEQENEIMVENKTNIKKAVSFFRSKCSYNFTCISEEDYIQEVSLALIKYIRRCETMDEIKIFPWYSAMGAMRDLVLKSQVLSGNNNSKRFKDIIHNAPKSFPIDRLSTMDNNDELSTLEWHNIDTMSISWVDDQNVQIDFDIFLSTQTDEMRNIVILRLSGLNLHEIAEKCGISYGTVWKRLNSLASEYKKYSGGAENE